jgi:hypothetical protein
MKRVIGIIGAAAMVVAGARAARADRAVEVTKQRLPPRIMLDVSVGGGVRAIGGMDAESASGMALGVEVGRRLHPHWGAVAVLEADAMARADYLSYGVWTVGLGVRWDGPVLVTAGAGLAFGSSKQLLPDYTLLDQSTSGMTAFVHGVVPLVRVGHARIGATGGVSVKAMTDAMITTASIGAGVAW